MVINNIDLSHSKILIVDDEERNRRIFSKWLQHEGYECHSASSGASALTLAAMIEPDLILLDIMMPEMNGFEVATCLKAVDETCDIPIIIITALDQQDALIQGLASGAEEFLSKPVDSTELKIRARNMLRLKKATDQLRNQNKILEEKVSQRTQELKQAYIETVASLGKAADYRDDETGAHVRRISYYSRELAICMGQEKDFCTTIFYASPLHDIGKIGTPDHILFKQGPLTDKEWVIMRSHAEVGAKILGDLNSPVINMGREIALNHHERWDGTGYPRGKTTEEIPLSARIMCICDIYDALRSKRPYKEAFSHEKSVYIILQGDRRTNPGHFDPTVLSAFKQCANEFDSIFNRLRNKPC